MAYDNQPVCPPTPCKQSSRSRVAQPVKDKYEIDYVGKIYCGKSYKIIFGKEHENPDLAGKTIQIENTDITIHISALSAGTLNMFDYVAEIRVLKNVLQTECRLETSNINRYYRGENLLSRFKSFKIKDSHGVYIDFSELVAAQAMANLEDKTDAKRVKTENDENQAASSANLEWRHRPVPRLLMFAESQSENPPQGDEIFKVPYAPVKRPF